MIEQTCLFHLIYHLRPIPNYTEPLLVIDLFRKLANPNCQSIGVYKAILKFQFTIFQTG
jgi:hypothetical protein